METERYQKYERAVKHVKELKEFFQHAAVYIGFVIVLLVFKQTIVDFILSNTEVRDSEFLYWIHVNINLIPFIWGAVVLSHGLYAYRSKIMPFKDWEDKKIQELMEEEEQKQQSTQWE